jgi:maltose-binding protein MalE
MYPFRLEIEFYWEPLNTAIKSVLDEGVDPASALQAAHDQIVAKIAKNR